MSKNEEQLKKWEQSIASFKKYNLQDVKRILKEIRLEDNIQVKSEMRKDLILGTLHVVGKFMRHSGFLCLHSSVYDIEDILNSCITVWIEYLDNGKIENLENFSWAFTSSFYSSVVFSIISSKYPIADFTVLSTADFEYVLYNFIEQKNRNINFRFEDFVKIVNESHRDTNNVIKCIEDKQKLKNTYYLLNSIYHAVYNNIPVKRIDYIKYMMIECGLEFSKKDITFSWKEFFDNQQSEDDIDILAYLSDILDEYELSLIKRYYGIGVKKHTLKEIGLQDGITRETVRTRHNKILEKARYNYRKYLDT